MTPRALLTAIGATAIAFAIVITSVAGSTVGATTTESRQARAIASDVTRLQTYGSTRICL